MSAGGDGLFRGSELGRLLLLLGVALAGWTAVFFYVSRPRVEPPRPVTAADLRPLPAADPAVEFQGLQDKQPLGAHDTPAYQLLLDRVRSTPPAELAKQARRDIPFRQLMENPTRYRGLPIRLDGTARAVIAQEAAGSKLFPSGRFFEAYAITTESFGYPMILVFEQAPPHLQIGENLYQPIAFEGYFLKLVAYPSARLRALYAPLLVGRLVAATDESRRNEPSSWSMRQWMFVILGLMLAVSIVRIAFGIRRSTRGAPITPIQASPREEINPQELERWLDGERRDAEGD